MKGSSGNLPDELRYLFPNPQLVTDLVLCVDGQPLMSFQDLFQHITVLHIQYDDCSTLHHRYITAATLTEIITEQIVQALQSATSHLYSLYLDGYDVLIDYTVEELIRSPHVIMQQLFAKEEKEKLHQKFSKELKSKQTVLKYEAEHVEDWDADYYAYVGGATLMMNGGWESEELYDVDEL